MKEKVKRLLDLVRAGKLTLDDAAPLLAALSTRLALAGADRELVQSLLDREDMDTGQIAEHLLLLRGVRDPVSFGFVVPPQPPRPPQPPHAPQPPRGPRVVIGGRASGLEDLGERIAAKIEHAAAQFAARAERLGENVEVKMDRFVEDIERTVDRAVDGSDRAYQPRTGGSRILRLEVSSAEGDSYEANLPVSLAPHLPKLIPPHGIRALEKAGFTIEALQMILEADPPSGPIIEASDEDGNCVEISIKGR